MTEAGYAGGAVFRRGDGVYLTSDLATKTKGLLSTQHRHLDRVHGAPFGRLRNRADVFLSCFSHAIVAPGSDARAGLLCFS